MSTTQRVGVAVVALGLMGLGVFLVMGKSDEPQPTSAPAKVPVLAAPTTPTTMPSEGTVAAPSNAVVVAPAATPTPVGAGGGAPTATPQVEYAPSPFEGSDSAELQYATKLVLGENTGPTEWQNAVGVFQRCLEQNPKNHLCRRGVAAAWERIDSDGGMPTTNLKVESLGTPTLDSKARDLRVRPDGIMAPAIQDKE